MTMIRAIVLCAICCASVTYAADEPASKPAAGEKALDTSAADKVLAEIAARFKASPALRARIVTEVEDLMGKRTEEGELLLDRPVRIRRKFTKPNLKVWLLNENYVQEYSANRNTLYTKDFSKAPKTLALLQSAVTVDVKALGELFTFNVFEKEKEGVKTFRLLLMPKPDTKQPVPYKRIQARIDDKELFFHEIEYVPENGDPTVEKYLEIKAIERPKEEEFLFEIPVDAKRKTDVIGSDAGSK